jgi:hypothetical protein
MNMAFQEPKCDMSIGMVAEAGLTEVPEATSMSCIPAAFISTIEGMEGMGMFMPGMLVFWAAARVVSINRMAFM